MDPEWLIQARAEGRILSERGANMPKMVPLKDIVVDPRQKKRKKGRTFATGEPASWAVILRPACRVISEANEREHWAPKGRRRKEQQGAVADVLFKAAVADHLHLFFPLAITFIHIGPKMDDDNLRSAFKACRDAIAHHVEVDDGDDRWTWKYDQRLETVPAKYGVEIRIEPTKE